MKTRFLLHGGGFSTPNENNDSFFKELTASLSDGDKVLFIGFARRDPAERLEIYERDKGYIQAQTDKNITVENAELETVAEQAQDAEAILITGGNTAGLVDDLRVNQDFLKAISGKVVGGSSAGAYLFATYYFACQDKEIREGLGVLPIRLMAHYGNPEFNATDETLKWFNEYPEELELIAIPECEWITKEIEI